MCGMKMRRERHVTKGPMATVSKPGIVFARPEIKVWFLALCE